MNQIENGEPVKSIWQQLANSCSGTAQDRRNSRRLVLLSLAWAICLLVVTRVLKSDPGFSAPTAWAIASLPTLLSIALMLGYVSYLRQADELMRKIQMDGLAFGFGAGAIFTMGYPLFELVGAPPQDAGDVLLVLILGWMFGQVIGLWRYR